MSGLQWGVTKHKATIIITTVNLQLIVDHYSSVKYHTAEIIRGVIEGHQKAMILMKISSSPLPHINDGWSLINAIF